MKICIKSALGEGPTPLASFDDALIKSGIANYNLIRLSSVIPPASVIIEDTQTENEPISWGDKLYLVYAEQRESRKGFEAWSGIGWVQDQKSGKGLFVEHEGESKSYVEESIKNSLEHMMSSRNLNFGEIKMKVIGGKCTNTPICALVVATYQVRGW